MRFDLLNVFLDTARAGSFAAAARLRHCDPSQVSRQIGILEESMGCRLFERTTRRLALTEAGQLVFERIQNPLSEIAEIQDQANAVVQEPQGVIRLATSVAFGESWLIPRLAAFEEHHPKIQFDLQLSDAQIDLAAERIDLAIRMGSRPIGDYVSRRLMTTRYRVVASPSFLEGLDGLRSGHEISKWLPGASVIAFPFAQFGDFWSFRNGAGEIARISVKPKMLVSNALAMRRATLEGLGLALLADWTIKDALGNGSLIDVFPEYDVAATDFDTAVWLMYLSRDYVPTKVRALIEFLVAETKQESGAQNA